MFMKANYSALQSQHPHKTMPELSRELAALWRRQPADAHPTAEDGCGAVVVVSPAAKPKDRGSDVILISDSD